MSDVTLSAKLEALSQCREIESVCIGLVYEFLICNNFKKTVEAFTEEITNTHFSLPKELPTKKDRIEKEDVIKIVSALEMEDHLQFFERWTELIPFSIKNYPEYKNITLPLYTYFATLPMRKEKLEVKKDVASPDIKSKNEILNSNEDVPEKDSTRTEKIADSLRNAKITSLSSTFTIDKPSVSGNATDTDYASERDFEPDSLDEVSDTEKTKRQQVKYKKSIDVIVLVTNEDGKSEKADESIKFITEEIIENSTNEQIEDSPEERDRKESENDNKRSPSAMAMFQDFLLEKKYSFNTEPQYLPLFALPFIQNPEEHEAFNQLFQDKWVRDLKESLQNFLIKFSCGDSVIPEIVKICKENQNLKNLVKKHSENHEDYSKLYKETRRKLHKLKRDHKNLVGVASELATALENSVRGEAVDIKSTLYKCVSIFPELFPHTHSTDPSLRNVSVVEKIEKDRMWLGPSQLDAKKIKDDLANASIKTKLLLMQALRWDVCSARSEDRETLVSWMGREDILGIVGEKGYGREWLSASEPHPLQQGIARLLNCIASLRTGRDYIAECSPPLITLVINVVGRVSGQDRVTLDMFVALLQKLSLRKEMCDEMIREGLLDWLSVRLSQVTSVYQLEYSTSLFMNLSIHAPLTYWDTRPHQVLPALLKLLTTPHEQVLEFVLGSLYCLLRSDKLNIFARSLGLSGELAGVSSQRCHRQAGALLKLHRRELSPGAVQLSHPQATEEDIEDPEDIETEINADDLVKGSPAGEQLLAQNYSLLFPTPSVVGRGSEDRLRLRPSTPRAIHSLPAWAI